jgi:hypothetical protein
MTDLLKKLHDELAEFFGAKGTEEVKKKSKPVVEEDDEEEEKPKRKVVVEDEDDDDEDEAPVKKKKVKATLVQVKAKLRELLDEKGKDATLKVMEAFDAEKVGEIDEDQYDDFIVAAQKVLDKGPSKKKKDEDDEDDL